MNKDKILVTGGAGYIGSFIVRGLAEEGFEPIIVDDLVSGHEEAVNDFTLQKINLVTQKDKLDQLFSDYKFTGVIHMAAFIQMGESYKNPLKYFNNNLISTLNLLECMVNHSVDSLVFSSSAGVYGNPERVPIKEDDRKEPENPYGETKLMIERVLKWFDEAHNVRHINIRYFNAAGAALDGSIGEDHPEESHLIPLAIKAALEGREFSIFGDDYNTTDGTCVRDYVHVLDLARAHTLAMNALLDGGKSESYNAGSGTGYSNKQIVETIKEVTKTDFKVRYSARRPGDADVLTASIEKIGSDLNWKPEYDLRDIIHSAYLWHKRHPQGYNS